jgi:L-seryl-tRNA(Ser) seleniumtransferase
MLCGTFSHARDLMSATPATDRFGNPIDPIVRYARGTILKSTDEEVQRMLRARHMVGERVRTRGKDSVYDLSGMNRGSGLGPDEVPHLTSHVPFFERFEGKTEPLALKHMGADPSRHRALILNRVSAANFIALTTILKPGDRVFGYAPSGGVTHPSVVRPVSMAGARFSEFFTCADLERAWQDEGAPRLLIITPITASKKHLDLADFKRALGLPRAKHAIFSELRSLHARQRIHTRGAALRTTADGEEPAAVGDDLDATPADLEGTRRCPARVRRVGRVRARSLGADTLPLHTGPSAGTGVLQVTETPRRRRLWGCTPLRDGEQGDQGRDDEALGQHAKVEQTY